MFTKVFEPLENLRPKTACMLPNVARYQLRHTPLPYYYISHLAFCQEILPAARCDGQKIFWYQVFFMMTVSTQSPTCSQASAQASRQS